MPRAVDGPGDEAQDRVSCVCIFERTHWYSLHICVLLSALYFFSLRLWLPEMSCDLQDKCFQKFPEGKIVHWSKGIQPVKVVVMVMRGEDLVKSPCTIRPASPLHLPKPSLAQWAQVLPFIWYWAVGSQISQKKKKIHPYNLITFQSSDLLLSSPWELGFQDEHLGSLQPLQMLRFLSFGSQRTAILCSSVTVLLGFLKMH